jgi:photosystem II stability/assembly factor-like uncharacterized protein
VIFVAADFVDASTGWAVGVDEDAVISAVVRTTDGGATWRKLVEIGGDLLRDVDFVDANTGWVAGDDGIIYRTDDGGETWNPERVGAGTWKIQHDVPAVTMKKNANSSEIVATESIASIFFIDPMTGWAAGDAPAPGNDPTVRRGVLYATTDGGTTWRDLNDAAGTAVPFALNDVWFVTSKEGWAVGGSPDNNEEDVILHTVDGGRSWARQHGGTAQFVRAVQFVDRTRGWAVGLTINLDTEELGPSKILGTVDGGQTWTPQLTSRRSFFDVVFVDPLHGWAVGDKATIYATADGGQTWRQQSRFDTSGSKRILPPEREVPAGSKEQDSPRARMYGALFFLDARNGWAGGDRVILRRAV